jgi:serine protease Do
MLPPGHPGMGPPGGDDDDGDSLERGQGAGFLISGDGYALTNHHVVESATRVWAYVGESKVEIPVEVVGSDEKSDVALLRLKAPGRWPFLPLADSDAVDVGDVVVAIGSPFGLEQSVSMGIVSARGRRDITPSGRQGLYDFLQTDASINPGNSGGPLLDTRGAVVGINSAVNAAGAGIGFAIPINQVKRMLPSIMSTGRFERSWIGVSIAPLSSAVRTALGVPVGRGALVREVVDGGPGSKAGLKAGDVITGFDGRIVHEANELPLLAGDAGVGANVPLEVIRDNAAITLRLTLESHPENAAVAENAEAKALLAPPPAKKDTSIGVAVVTLDDDHRMRLGLPKGIQGARISKLRPGSPAYMAGIGVDDVVVSVDGAEVNSAEAFADVVKAAKDGAVLRLILRRGGGQVFAALEKP